MADEGTITVVLSFDKDGTSFEAGVNDLSFDVAGTVVVHNRQEFTTTAAEALVLGDAGVGGYLLAINRDDTNSVSITGDLGETEFADMKPGEAALFRIGTKATAPSVVATGGAVELEYWLIAA